MALDDTKTAEQMAAEVKADFASKFDAVKEIAEDALGKAAKGEELANGIKEKADEALTEMNGLKASLDELEQKLARGGQAGEEGCKTFGERFTESEEFKSFAANPRKGDSASVNFEAELKADLTTTTGGAGGMGAAVHSTHIPGIMPLPQRRMTVRNLLMPGRTDGPLIDFDRETGFANNADMVAEGDLKPQSDITVEEVQTRTKVIAHWMRASKQTLSDVAQIRSIIDNRLLYGLGFKEEQQLLYGDNTGENLHGIVPQATAYSAPIAVGSETSIDKVRLMALQATLAEYPSTGIVMHPSDWAFIELLKDSEGRYIIGNPQGSLAPTLWGLPVVTTQAMQIDKVLVGAFDMGAQIFDQWSARIETGFQNDDFTRNKVTVLAEERLALAVYRPESFIYGDFGRVA
ncbi:phage major capsid protein [Phaeobacter italicus]|uniref:phage major capsid protein n=1 Tax=Phaeobacter italicus TaxID=481446 RepID=UPI001C976D45|nr:phage major capsid protein [Phaeobacter italicus]MBY5976723.1 phage major capsid protein [Phaeobacter italicus]